MLRNILRYFLLLNLLLGSGAQLFGSHALGGNFRFESLDSCTTRVFVDVYYDCSGLVSFPNVPGLGNLFSIQSNSLCPAPLMLTAWT
ncbi:MAG: hypothetical protein AAFP02_15685, partial [Bacteroidota bacterium]